MSFFWKRLIFPLNCLWTLVEKQLITYVREYFWHLYSIPLIYGSVTLISVNSPNLFFFKLFWLVLVTLLYILGLAHQFLKKNPADITGFCKCIDQLGGELTSWQYWIFQSMNTVHLSTYLVFKKKSCVFCSFQHIGLLHVLLDVHINISWFWCFCTWYLKKFSTSSYSFASM